MCGIFAFSRSEQSSIEADAFRRIVDNLFLLSESRGKEASGVALGTPDEITVIKKPYAASRLVRCQEYRSLFRSLPHIADSIEGPAALALVGHSRLVTSGTEQDYKNNQPVIRNGVLGVHNGIVVNEAEIWGRFPHMNRECVVDTEVILALIAEQTRKDDDPVRAFIHAFKIIEGASSVVLLFREHNSIVFGTNNGSLYFLKTENELAVASEELMLKRLIEKTRWYAAREASQITQVAPHTGYVYNSRTKRLVAFSFDGGLPPLCRVESERIGRAIRDATVKESIRDSFHFAEFDHTYRAPSEFEKHFQENEQAVRNLRRCTRCILPETMPFITFDEGGVCNYCRRHRKMQSRGKEALERVTTSYRTNGSRANCIHMLSGGRDSSYGLYYLKEVLGMNPTAYTYDWGMVTDIARRNISRLCHKLRVEHLLISADIRKKREYVRKNVLAWLRHPNLGTVPLFMAGDKHYFNIANRLGKDLDIELIVSCRNPLEKTDFKSGFSGVYEGTRTIYRVPFASKTKIVAFYLTEFLKNPAYLNSSLFDTITGYLSAYAGKHNYLFLFDYIRWDERVINRTLRDQFNWEVATDTTSTWRIGDGTAAFYNYIYYTVAGFTENDTFISNMVREGMISREQALETAHEQNRPRFPSLKWYCDIIGIDFEQAIRTINNMGKLHAVTRG